MSTLILCFHRVAAPETGGRSVLSVSPADFERVLDEVGSTRKFVSLEEGMKFTTEQRAVVTFDDGYADNLYTAMPILARRKIPSSFFIASGFIGTPELFPADTLDRFCDYVARGGTVPEPLAEIANCDYWSALEMLSSLGEKEFWALNQALSSLVRDRVLLDDPLRRPMTAEELQKLSKMPGVTLGPHTHSHRRLTALKLDEALADVRKGTEWLKAQGFSLLSYFAYPFGQSSDISRVLTGRIRDLGYEPLTTLPTLVTPQTQRAFRSVGVSRLSVGPNEVPLMSMLSKVLPVASAAPKIWLSALSTRRLIFSARKSSSLLDKLGKKRLWL